MKVQVPLFCWQSVFNELYHEVTDSQLQLE